MEEYDKEIIDELEKNIYNIAAVLDKWDILLSSDKMDNLTKLMRYAHTIKSVASFMENEKIQSAAHTLEDKIAGINNIEEISDDLPMEIRTHLNIIAELADFSPGVSVLKNNLGGEKKTDENSFAGLDLSNLSTPQQGVSSEIEKKLLERAFQAGERLYRLDCQLDTSEALPYARAYLINRNLEEAGTVLRTAPSLINKSADFSRFSLIFTTDLKEKEIKRELQIDSIDKIRLRKLDIVSYISEDITDIEDDSSESSQSDLIDSVTFPISKLHDIEVNLEELILLNEEIELSEPVQYKKISNVLDNLTKIVSGAVSTDLRLILEDWHRFVSDVGERLSKNVVLNLNCDNIRISKNRSLLIESCLRQLVHNSISHGIESPLLREQTGKAVQAIITIVCRVQRGNLIIEYSDDGAGINEDQLKKRGIEQGIIPGDNDLTLLEMLALPGLSSKDKADLISGRGAGMDIVLSTVQESLGGRIRLENRKGEGVSFFISLPLKDTHYDVLIFQSGDLFYSLPKENIETTFTLESNNIEKESEGRFFYWVEDQRLPVYEKSNHINTDPLKHKFGIVVRNGFHRGVVVADDLVMEKRLDSAQFTKCAKEESYIYDIKDGDNSFGYRFLSPLMIQK